MMKDHLQPRLELRKDEMPGLAPGILRLLKRCHEPKTADELVKIPDNSSIKKTTGGFDMARVALVTGGTRGIGKAIRSAEGRGL